MLTEVSMLSNCYVISIIIAYIVVVFWNCQVERTKKRPIACGEITRSKAFVFLGLPLSASLAILLTLNSYTSVHFVFSKSFYVLLCTTTEFLLVFNVSHLLLLMF